MKVEIEKPQEKFKKHLQHLSNSRIIVSGKFGTGKSYFLKDYFLAHKKEYNLFWIAPINYVVGGNQDIFEWIKIDIARDLVIEHLPSTKEKRIKNNLLIQSYLYNNAATLFSKLIQVLTNEYLKANTNISLLDSFKKEIEEYQSFSRNTNDSLKVESENLNNFLNFSFAQKGSIYEDDVTTQIIRSSILLLAEKDQKKNILIIDDLDRLDPEHIFRILNILSAHNDHFDSNKFGFNHVIVVCDLENIENLYRYRYGEKADFDGYIEKFYSYEPFNFSTKNAIIHFCENDLSLVNLDISTKNTITLILVCLFSHDKLRMRNLKKISEAQSSLTVSLGELKTYQISFLKSGEDITINSKFFDSTNFEIDFSKFDLIKGLFLVSVAFGGVNKFIGSLEELDTKLLKSQKFDEMYLPDLFESSCILSHIAKSQKNQRDIFFVWNKLNTQGNFGLVDAKHPLVNFFGKNFQLPVKWNSTNRYTDGHYFASSDPKAGLTTFKLENNLDHVCNFFNLITEIKAILELLVDEGIV